MGKWKMLSLLLCGLIYLLGFYIQVEDVLFEYANFAGFLLEIWAVMIFLLIGLDVIEVEDEQES